MNTQTRLLRKTALAAAVAIVVSGVASVGDFAGLETGMSPFVSTAYAAGDGGSGGGQKGAMGENRGGQGGKGAGGQGHKGGKSMADVLADEADDDSDRPDWAGVPGGEGRPGGGGNPSPGDTKGDTYGDMIMLLRDPVTGLPVTTEDGWTLACTDLACSPDQAVVMVDGEVPEGTTTYEVDFGRASVARSPASVIDHALAEALDKLTASDVVSVSTDTAGRITITTADGTSTIDSPLENLALYIDLVKGLDSGSATVAALTPYDLATLDTAASLLAGVADKTGDIGIDFVMYENLIAGVEVDFTDFAYTRSFPDNYVYLWAPDTETEPVYKTLDVNVYLDGINDPLPADGEFAALFAAAADDALEVIELVHTQIVISADPLPGTAGE
jgi:hypothetical protein